MLFLLYAVDLQTEPGVADKLRLKIDDALLNNSPFFSCSNNIALTMKRGGNYLGLFISVRVLHFSKIATALL